MTRKTIFIVRHGETDFNRQRIIQGSGVDSQLNATGKRQAQALFQHYKHLPFQGVLTSKLQRTHQTVKGFIESGIPWEQFAEINEMNWGIHEGKSGTPDMVAEYQAVRSSWGNGDYEARITGGESAAELRARIKTFVNHLRQRSEEHILICSHGRAMSALMSVLKQEELKRMNQYKNSNTGVWKTNFSRGLFRFEMENNTEHLEPKKEVIGDG